MRQPLLLCVLLLADGVLLSQASRVSLHVGADFATGRFTLSVHDQVWLQSADIGYRTRGEWLSVARGNLVNCGFSNHSKSWTWLWCPQSPAVGPTFSTRARIADEGTSIVFTQTFLQAVSGMAAPHTASTSPSYASDTVVSSFPSFLLDSNTTAAGATALNFLQYTQRDLTRTVVGRFSQSGVSDAGFVSGEGGPLMLYSSTLTTAVVSSWDHFVISSSAVMDNSYVAWGFNGKLKAVDANTSHTVAMVVGEGFGATMMDWGDRLLAMSGKPRHPVGTRFNNRALHYLGYATDNGAYYYYNLVPTTANYEDTMKTIIDVLEVKLALPVKYYQLDSWWYFKNDSHSGGKPNGQGGIILWQPRPDVFPDGMNFFGQLNTSLWLHSRYFDPLNDYAKQGYKFLSEPNNWFCSLPVDSGMFEKLFRQGHKWGMVVYEQDWMSNMVWQFNRSLSELGVVERWVGAMDSGAHATNTAVMIDSTLVSQVLQSTQYHSFVQASTTMDYSPGSSQWANGFQSQLFHACGLIGWKDTFFTSHSEPGCRYTETFCLEPNPELQALVAVLSGGPVTFGDRLDRVNSSLIMRTCRSDGAILRADRPHAPLDQVLLWTWHEPQQAPHVLVTATTSTLGGADTWWYLLVANLTRSLTITPRMLPSAPSSSTTSSFVVTMDGDADHLVTFSESSPLAVPAMDIPPWNASFPQNCTVPPCGLLVPFAFYTVHPVLHDTWVVLGELSKFVSVTRADNQTLLGGRFVGAVSATSTSLNASVVVMEQEVVPVHVLAKDTSASTTGRFARIVVECHNEDAKRRVMVLTCSLTTEQAKCRCL